MAQTFFINIVLQEIKKSNMETYFVDETKLMKYSFQSMKVISTKDIRLLIRDKEKHITPQSSKRKKIIGIIGEKGTIRIDLKIRRKMERQPH